MTPLNPDRNGPVTTQYRKLVAQRQHLVAEIGRVDAALEAYQFLFTMATHADAAQAAAAARQRGQTIAERLEEALIEIARRHGGVFDTYSDKEELFDRGLLHRDTRNLSQRIYHALNSSRAFKKGDKKGSYVLRHRPWHNAPTPVVDPSSPPPLYPTPFKRL